MKIGRQRTIVVFVSLFSVVLCLTSVILLSTMKNSNVKGPVTEEEAVEISKNSKLVQEGLTRSSKFTVETDYYNSSRVEQLKGGPDGAEFEKTPEGHSVWQVIWWLFYQTKPGGYDIIVIVDAETGKLLHEETGIELL
jgi:hypothetical protein